MEKYTGKILKRSFVNKAGKTIPHVFDLYFETQEKNYIILQRKHQDALDSNFLEQEVDKEVIVLATIQEGLWDDDGNSPYPVQSRFGPYMVIFRIQKS